MMLAPMLSEPISRAQLDLLEADDEWEFSQKADGHRRLIYVRDGQVIPLNRSGGPTTLPLHMVRVLGAQRLDFAVDGELVGKGADRRLWLFDVPYIAGLVDVTTPYYQRRAALITLHDALILESAGIHILPTAQGADNKRAMKDQLLDHGAEGVMAKHLQAPYLSGQSPTGKELRSPLSLKYKRLKTVDCVVTGVGAEGHDNLILGLYGPDGVLIRDVGHVTAQAGHGPRLKAMHLADPDAPDERRPVAEVQVLYVTPGDRLYQPTRPKLRVDKTPRACTTAQLPPLRTDRSILTEGSIVAHR